MKQRGFLALAAVIAVVVWFRPQYASADTVLSVRPGTSLSGKLADPGKDLTWVLASGATAGGDGGVDAFLCKKSGANRCHAIPGGVTLVGTEVPSGPDRIVIRWHTLLTGDGCTMKLPRDVARAAAGQSCLAKYHLRLTLPTVPTVIAG
jgi:hypothetical protein